MTDRPIRLAASGTGRHSLQSHLRPALATQLYELVAFYDPLLESRRRVYDLESAVYACISFDELLERGADAIVICGPDDTHLEQAALAIDAGLHVLVDKPVMVSVGQAGAFHKLIDAAAERNRVLTTCLPRRVEDRRHPYGWTLATLPELVAEFGELLSVSLDFSYHRPDVAGTWREGRSLLLDHFPHDGDFAYKVARAASDSEALPLRALSLKADDPLQYAVAGTIGDLPFMCHGSRYEPDGATFAERIQLRFKCGYCVVEVLHGDVELGWFASGRRELTHVTPINRESGGYDHRSIAMMVSFANAILRGKGGHAYLTYPELALAAEASPELLESGLYVSR